MDRLIEVRDLVKEFRGRGLLARRRGAVRAVDRVSFDIRRGEVFGLVGESGCGKTTLARALLYLDPPTSGEVWFDGAPVAGAAAGHHRRPVRLPREFRRRAQIVFQDPNGALDPKMRIRDSLQEGLINLGVPAGERSRRVKELLERVGLESGSRVMGGYPHEFSGGQKQRLVVARALSMEPSFLVLDEPVSNLDVSVQAQIINLLLDLKDSFSLTYLFISHDLNLVGYLSDRLAVMHRGRIVELGDTARLLERPLHPYTRRLFASRPSLHGPAAPGRPCPSTAPGRPAEGGEDAAGGSCASAEGGEDAAGESASRFAQGGCAWVGRCAGERLDCREMEPELREAGEGHQVACLQP